MFHACSCIRGLYPALCVALSFALGCGDDSEKLLDTEPDVAPSEPPEVPAPLPPPPGSPADWAPAGIVCQTLAGTVDGDLVVIEVDMETEEWAAVERYSTPYNMVSFQTSGFARIGDELIAGLASGGVFYLDTATGDTRVREGSGVLFSSVGSLDGEWVAECPPAPTLPFSDDLCTYSDFDAILAAEPSNVLTAFPLASRFGIDGAVVYSAWHATDTVFADDLSGGELREIQLEQYDDWVWGLSETTGLLHVINDGRGDNLPETRIAQFDVETGALVNDVHLLLPAGFARSPSGLRCRNESD